MRGVGKVAAYIVVQVPRAQSDGEASKSIDNNQKEAHHKKPFFFMVVFLGECILFSCSARRPCKKSTSRFTLLI